MRRPVFVDSTGRRRRAAIILGSGLGVLLITGLIVLLAGIFSGSPVKLPGWPDAAPPDAAPSVAPHPEPSATSKKPATTGIATTGTPTVSTSAPGNGNGNGQGNSHRPTKSPGKP